MIASNEDFQSVSAGYQHTCASTATGATYCWGVDDFGVLGSSNATPNCFSGLTERCTATPQRVVGNVPLSRVVAGEFHTCALSPDGIGYCWGWNSNNQLGSLAEGNAILHVPTQVISSRAYLSLGAGTRHNCAVTVNDRLECWGRNGAGEIGVIAGTALGAPEPLTAALQAHSVDAGEMHSCALTIDARVYCWGALLGNGTTASSSTPVQVSVTGAATFVSAGGDHACAIVERVPWCWGSNSNGQLGVSGSARSEAPVRVQVGQ
jgi:alpha-tubulin suppressor-like RCC1 family protein